MEATVEYWPGDLLFYRTGKVRLCDSLSELSAVDVTGDFAALAAVVQAHPYAINGQETLPWHHVAVWTGEGSVVGFESTDVSAENTGALIRRQTFDAEALRCANIKLDVVRPPKPIADRIAKAASDAADATEATPYTVRGLMAFALASLAWLTPVGHVRRTVLRRARGAAQIARAEEPKSETCTTSVAGWVEQAMGEPLHFEEPPAIATCRNDGEAIRSQLEAVLEELADRLEGGRLANLLVSTASCGGTPLPPMFRELPGVAGTRRLTPAGADAINALASSATQGLRMGFPTLESTYPVVMPVPPARHNWRFEDNPDVDFVLTPGFDAPSTTMAAAMYQHALQALANVSLKTLDAEGARFEGWDAGCLLLSPAMLWQALRLQCWEVLPEPSAC